MAVYHLNQHAYHQWRAFLSSLENDRPNLRMALDLSAFVRQNQEVLRSTPAMWWANVAEKYLLAQQMLREIRLDIDSFYQNEEVLNLTAIAKENTTVSPTVERTRQQSQDCAVQSVGPEDPDAIEPITPLHDGDNILPSIEQQDTPRVELWDNPQTAKSRVHSPHPALLMPGIEPSSEPQTDYQSRPCSAPMAIIVEDNERRWSEQMSTLVETPNSINERQRRTKSLHVAKKALLNTFERLVRAKPMSASKNF